VLWVATSGTNPGARSGPQLPAGDTARVTARSGPEDGRRRGGPPRLPPVRLAPREELAAAARVAPLLRAARDVARWARDAGMTLDEAAPPGPETCAAAAADLELSPAEVDAAWRVAGAARMLGGEPAAGQRQPSGDVLASATAEEILATWDAALAAVLAAEELDGLATALYTVGGPVRMEALFDAYAAAAGTRRSQPEPARPGPAGSPPDRPPAQQPPDPAGPAPAQPDQAAELSAVLETLADLGVVELGTDDPAGGLTVALSPLGVWGVHRRLRAQGWHVPVLGGADRSGATALLATLASCDAEDGEAEISSWLSVRPPAQAAAELIQAAGSGSPGLRGAAFAVLDRIGAAAIDEVRSALADPVLRAHAAVWLHEHGEEAELRPEDRAWLLVDLGAGLLEEAEPTDVVAELLPDVAADAQAEIVAGLWRVDHPGVTDLLTALSEHHPDPAVARAARKAAFKARSASAGGLRQAP
jgi:hypothetical protein